MQGKKCRPLGGRPATAEPRTPHSPPLIETKYRKCLVFSSMSEKTWEFACGS